MGGADGPPFWSVEKRRSAVRLAKSKIDLARQGANEQNGTDVIE